ncbi:MAG: hypothetical protein SX243_09720 [Acidobacteriota bacterium]|nr:hypothetical protein [Acidobacteriota bacterium]
MASTPNSTRNAETSSPLSNLQLELLKLYSTGVSSEDLLEVKRLLGLHFAHKATQEADRLWDERRLTDEDMDAWLNE